MREEHFSLKKKATLASLSALPSSNGFRFYHSVKLRTVKYLNKTRTSMLVSFHYTYLIEELIFPGCSMSIRLCSMDDHVRRGEDAVPALAFCLRILGVQLFLRNSIKNQILNIT